MLVEGREETERSRESLVESSRAIAFAAAAAKDTEVARTEEAAAAAAAVAATSTGSAVAAVDAIMDMATADAAEEFPPPPSL